MRTTPGQCEIANRLERILKRVAQDIESARYTSASRSLRRILLLPLDRHIRFRALLLDADCCLETRRFSSARNSLDNAIPFASNPEDIDRLELTRAYLLALSGSALEALHRAVPILRKSGPLEEERAKSLWIIGLACYRRGHYTWARRCFRVSEAFYRLTNRGRELAHVLMNLALVAKSEGKLTNALNYLDEAASCIHGETHPKTRLLLLVNRGICLYKTGDIAGSRTCLMEARALASDGNEPVLLIMVYNNLGHVFMLEKNYRVAAEFYAQALEMAQAEASPRQECLALEFLGEVYGEQARYDEALRCLDKAYALAKKLAAQGDLMMEVLRRRGECHAGLGNLESAQRDLKRAIVLCRARGEKREQALAQRAYALRFSESTENLATSMREVLDLLREVGDRFEFARTVCLILEDGRLDPELHLWMSDSVATAIHYFSSLGLDVWRVRLQRLVGPAYRPNRVREPAVAPSDTKSSLYVLTLEAAQLAARSREPALIQGETGVGKEVIAGLVHAWSSRASGPLIAINCGALPETLVESELFGHVRGAFTGADRDKTGLLEVASGGTVLLDEIADLPSHTQVKLLRFLDTGEIRRLGDTKTRKVDIRVLAATNKTLAELVQRSRFREDLFYRLNVFRISVPSLRERREDILPLAEKFLREAAQGQSPAVLSPEMRTWLVRYDWPGNVRQLRNLCSYLATRAWGKSEISIRDLPPDLPPAAGGTAEDSALSAFEFEKRELERAQILRALRETRGSISKAAKLLGIGRNGLSLKLRELGVDRESFR